MSEYIPPNGSVITLNFKGENYVAPNGDVIALEFNIESSEPIVTQYLFPIGIVDNQIAGTSVRLQYTYLYPTGFKKEVFGAPSLKNLTQIVRASNWQSSNVGRPSNVVSYFKDIYPRAFDSSVYGRPLVYNLTQYRQLSGINSQAFGTAYLQGGVKYLSPRAFDASGIGKPVLLNTTANQEVKPSGINSLVVSKPDVSPRILYAKGFVSLVMGVADIRSPVLLPKGLIHSKYGNATVWFHTRYLTPGGIISYESGYPKAFDPTRFVTPAPFNRSAVFGDIGIKNKSVFIKPASIFDEVVTPWAVVENNRRFYKPAGINSQAFGDIGVRNKTPSLFIQPIPAPPVNTPVISYRIRSVKPAGFDQLAFGRPQLTKTPELLPKGIASPTIDKPTIWYRNRVLDVKEKGIDSFKAGIATMWFRYRYSTPNSWLSSKFAEPSVTHGLRNIDVKGFVREAYGTPWVSRGTRFIEPSSIYKEFATNHMVGGTRYLKPIGYVATQWGTRIIPESQTVYPLGFTGVFGQSKIGLYTRYLKPFGYISVGNQPADRWGATKLYNKRQYITQVFDNTSGLVPPKWSDWQSIQNRNKQIGVTGFNSQKFGYSQVDNNAAPLLVKGIAPPVGSRFDVSMVSHAIRPVKIEGIAPFPMSSWSVVRNGARVIGVKGIEATLFGIADAVKTRRYYDRVGRIDSFESGTPMISYRVRTIDVEKRYSIAPPIIRLPTVDLYTRYVTFLGFEAAKYGEPSLSIRFNIIAPRWVHRNNLGEPRLHNVTPELQQRGHNSEVFGNTSIRTQWRNVYAQGDRATLFGLARISDTKQNIIVRGWQDTVINQKLVVTKTGTNPYVTQNIFLTPDNDIGEGEGIAPPSMGQPGMNQNVLYARGFLATSFGTLFIRSNNLQISVGIAIDNIPIGPTVINTKRGISLDEDGNGIAPTLSYGKPRLNPHTIWATTDTPRQAQQNHEGLPFHEVDFYVNQQAGQQRKIGKPTLTLQHRTLTQRGHASARVGAPELTLKTRYIEPPTIRGFAMGIPEIPFTLKKISVDKQGFLSERHGKAEVARPPYVGPQSVAPKGIASLGMGSQRIEPLHRSLETVGHNSLRMGTRLANDKPYMWQGLRIGEHVPMIIGGDDMSVFGKTTVSLRIREITIEGFVAFRSEYTLEQFNKRMIVKGTSTETIKPTKVSVDGINSIQMGALDIRWGQQFIRPDGNSDQFRKGGYHA